MSWLLKKKTNERVPWFQKRDEQNQRIFKNINKTEEESLESLNSRLRERITALEKSHTEEPGLEDVVYSDDIQKMRIRGLERPFAEPENGRTFVLGYPFAANGVDEEEKPEKEEPTVAKSKPRLSFDYSLKDSTLAAPEVKAKAEDKPESVKLDIEAGENKNTWKIPSECLEGILKPVESKYRDVTTGAPDVDYEIVEEEAEQPKEESKLSMRLAALQDDESEDEDELSETPLEPEVVAAEAEENTAEEDPEVPIQIIPLLKEKSEEGRASVTPILKIEEQYHIPFNRLKTTGSRANLIDPRESQRIITTLEETLDQFGIEGRVMGIQRGPIITRYEIKMAPGIKVSRILGLSDELAMALEALKVRIEAPIPGRSTVGIEIPNKKRDMVLLGDILNDSAYQEFEAELPLPFGKDIAGNLVLADLVKMPHLLIAGATGSGKSVAVNSFITNIILNKSPEEVRFMLVDPKLVELSHFNDIPHLLHPVITDAPKAIHALNWAVEEMERRYEDMADLRARDIRGYNKKVEAQKGKNKKLVKMPYIILLIDELGDLMMVAGKEVESSIIRLSQKARAVGIHLVLATQRPSVDVITALIKANCPARIALQVAQKTDSRTILDSNGAEQLLGQGDMLFKHPAKAMLQRIQAPLITDEEVEIVVKQAKTLGKPRYIKLEDPKGKAGALESEDEALFEEAWNIILESGKASASYLQRRLRIGYNRAARLIEAFEARGLIGPQIGSKPREILVNSALQ